MYAVCLRYARDRDEAQDILQEGFVRVFERITQFEGRGSLEGWIRRIVVHTAIDLIRKQRHIREELALTDAHIEDAGTEEMPDHVSLEYLFKIIQDLPAGYRIVFNLFAIEGFSHAEIGEQLGITESSSRSQFTRAKAALQKRIHEDSMEKYLPVPQQNYRHVVGR